MVILANSDFFSIFNQRRRGLNEIIPSFYFSFYLEQSLVELSKMSSCLKGWNPPTRDGPLLCCLPHSYNNFNLPTSLLSQVPLIWQASYIVSFYPQYILNFFTSLFTWPPGQRNSLTSPLTHLWKYTFSRILTHNQANRKELYNQGIKKQSTRHQRGYLKKTGFSGFIWKSDSFLNGNSLLVLTSVQVIVFSLLSECHVFFLL